jgi:nicotinate phosphoribosyltransferase
VTAGDALFTDYYELTMAQAYLAEGMANTWATFSLFARCLPERRNYLVACGLAEVLDHLERLRFTASDLDYLRSLGAFSEALLEHLRELRFEGDVRAVPEGTPVFADEPLLEVDAPIIQAQLVETYLVNAITAQTSLASKASRVVTAAAGRSVLDFGLRRGHGGDGGVRSARAYHVAGITASSNVLAGKRYGSPVAGTMAHSYVQAHERESDAFRAFVRSFPSTVLLVDTYDTLAGVRRVIDLAEELGPEFRVRAVRLDSGDLAQLSRQTRRLLDAAGLERVQILASGGLDEDAIAKLVASGSPIDGFGVGSSLAVSADAPTLDTAYKLTEIGGTGRMKLSPGKLTRPGRKQVARRREAGISSHDILGGAREELPGEPLLRYAMRGGRRLAEPGATLEEARARCAREVAALPAAIRSLEVATPGYPVTISAKLARDSAALARAMMGKAASANHISRRVRRPRDGDS